MKTLHVQVWQDGSLCAGRTAEPGRRGNPASRAGASRTAESEAAKLHRKSTQGSAWPAWKSRRCCQRNGSAPSDGASGDQHAQTNRRSAMPSCSPGHGSEADRGCGSVPCQACPAPMWDCGSLWHGAATNLRSREAGRTLCAARLCSVAAHGGPETLTPPIDNLELDSRSWALGQTRACCVTTEGISLYLCRSDQGWEG